MKHLSGAETCVTEILQASKIWPIIIKSIFAVVYSCLFLPYFLIVTHNFCCLLFKMVKTKSIGDPVAGVGHERLKTRPWPK
jgi:hypothetical protein